MMKKKINSKDFWRITDQHREEDWGNIQLPHITDEELHSTRANVRINNRRRAQDPQSRWSKNTRAKNRALAQNPRWILSNAQKNRRMAQDPLWNKKNRMGHIKRKQQGKKLLAEGKIAERRAYFGGVQQHTEKTLRQMSKSAQARWARTQRSVWCEGVQYANIYAAAETLQCHPTTILYRIRTRPQEYRWWKESDQH
jgi:hypothetical protein